MPFGARGRPCHGDDRRLLPSAQLTNLFLLCRRRPLGLTGLCRQPLTEEERLALDAQLYTAAKDGDAAAVERLAGEGASADAKHEGGWPAVVWAAHQGHTEVVEALLRLGCDPNAPNRNGGTALMDAAGKGHGGVVGALLEHGGADLDAVDSEGGTALMLAAAYGNAAVAAQLVEAGADATLRATGGGWEGKTALRSRR